MKEETEALLRGIPVGMGITILIALALYLLGWI